MWAGPSPQKGRLFQNSLFNLSVGVALGHWCQKQQPLSEKHGLNPERVRACLGSFVAAFEGSLVENRTSNSDIFSVHLSFREDLRFLWEVCAERQSVPCPRVVFGGF